MGQSGAPAAYRGYRRQILYTLSRILAPGVGEDLAFQPEGQEDLAVRGADGNLVEVIQVKSRSNLVLSDLTPEKPGTFFHRIIGVLQSVDKPIVRLVNIGSIGPELRQAWEGKEPHRTRVYEKLLGHGFTAPEAESIFAQLELVELDEVQVTDSVFSFLRNSLAGIDPESAFDLLSFWLYKAAEHGTLITRASLISKMSDVGGFLVARHTYQDEWFTSIIPLVLQPISDIQHSQLRNEFYAGISARYEHILAGIDFRRDGKLEEIAKAFERSRVVIVHAASGQGKTTLAYRYLHDTYPETWRFSIELVENRQHALKIATALAGYAEAVQAPMAVYVDVRPHDKEWPELVKRLGRHSFFQVLVTIREEDFRRANISGAELDYASVELSFDEAEAWLIYERAIASGFASEFLDFDEAWVKFGGDGPLMEFIYLLTQTTTLRERLHEQVTRIRKEIQNGARPDTLRVLCLVSVASAYEARLDTRNLIKRLNLPDPDYTLRLLEEEYLIRISSDRGYIEGLHPIRSRIITDLLTSSDISPWLDVATEALPLMLEEDLESFILYAFVDRPSECEDLLLVVKQLQPKTWTGLAGMFRSLLWIGVHDYVVSNMTVVEAAQEEFGDGWWTIIDFDVADVTAEDAREWWRRLRDLIPKERQAKIEEIRAGQSPKGRALKLAVTWLAQLDNQPSPPTPLSDWIGVAELCFWAGHLGAAQHVEQWLLDDDLIRAANELPIPQVAHLSLALYTCNKERHTDWIDHVAPTLHARLAEDYGIVFLEEQETTLKLHFIISDDNSANEQSQLAFSADQRSSDPLHQRTLERIELVRGLFPHYEAYGSQGYGHKLGSFELPFDSTVKSGISASHLLPVWPVRVNSLAQGLGRNRFRAASWREYVEQILQTRELWITCLRQLRQGLAKYLQRNRAVDLHKYVDMDLWSKCESSIRSPLLLPKSAVDQWGFAQEGLSGARTLLLEQLGDWGQRPHIQPSIALYKYKAHLEAAQDFTFSLSAFLWQAPHVIITNSVIGKLPVDSPEHGRRTETLQRESIRTDLAHLTTQNLFEAARNLANFQKHFGLLFRALVDNEKLAALEDEERELMNLVWQLWYFFANRPLQQFSTPLSQVPGKISLTKRDLEKQVARAAETVATEGTRVTVLPFESDWDKVPSLCLRLDLEDPLDLYPKIEALIVVLRENIGHIDFQELRHYVIRQNWEYVVIVPVIRGKMLNQLVWRLHTFTTVLQDDEMERQLWSYIPQLIPEQSLEEYGLELWNVEEIDLANQFSAAVAQISFLAAHISDFHSILDATEPGFQVLQCYIDEQASRLNERLQAVLDTMELMLDKFNRLPESKKLSRNNLITSIKGLIEIRKFVMPSEEFDGTQEFDLDQLFEYTQRLEQARLWAETIKLFWVADVLDHTFGVEMNSTVELN